ncbi:CAP domain-containing protein [Aspergillus aurantiobrunneus]
MKSSMILGALGALGAMAIEPSYVTEWTTTTVTDWTTITTTTTLTVQPTTTSTSTPTPASISTSPPDQIKVQESAPEPSTTSAATPTSTVASVGSSTTSVPPTSTVASEEPANPIESAFSGLETAWSSVWSSSETTTSTAAPSSTQAPANDYQSKVLHSHNVHRANHSSPDLTWSSDLEASARVLASRCVYEHDANINGGGYGQNIGYGTSADDVDIMISNLMYNDEMGFFENLYGLATPDFGLFDKWGHFSQIVWKASTQVGCATVQCDSLGNVDSTSAVPFTVCNYNPQGNVGGEYGTNVLAPLGKAMYSA